MIKIAKSISFGNKNVIFQNKFITPIPNFNNLEDSKNIQVNLHDNFCFFFLYIFFITIWRLCLMSCH